MESRDQFEKKGVPTPEVWSHHTDNAANAARNNTTAKFASFTVFKKQFNLSELTSNTVGHTHVEQDERFAMTATANSATTGIQNDEDFVNTTKLRVIKKSAKKTYLKI